MTHQDQLEQEIMMDIRSKTCEWFMRMSPLHEYAYAFASSFFLQDGP
ncbi:hypothetical protein SETIT_8G242400v2 [Setaria italica]|uniref:Uncharacterized protein n=1 Tax=Setaria italica TaxID=4555 RepID=A0A368SCW1_SETIT|nr:hypothetical protein SETIT_8G242400v2 [Setaria italica]